jgi:CubicO group peptidase (beta-lactamase class C family)
MTTAPNSSSVAQELDNVISTALALNRIVGTVIMVAREGEIVYERAAGFADREARRSARPDRTYAWGGVYGHSWFVDPHLELSVVALTNTTTEGVTGVFPAAIRDAVYRAIAE